MSKSAIAIIIAGVIALSGAYYAGYKHDDLEWSAKWAARDKSDADQNAKNVKAAADESKRRNNERDNTQKVSDEKLKQAQADAASASADAKRLLGQLNALRSVQRAGHSTIATGKSTADRAGDLQAVMLSESIGRNQQLANYADNLRVSVESCNDQYNSLTIKKAP